MKTYTFKIKCEDKRYAYPLVLTAIHCPLEVFYNSVKATTEIKEFYEGAKEDENFVKMYVTVCDYVPYNSNNYITSDLEFCDFTAILETNDLKEFLTHNLCYGLKED